LCAGLAAAARIDHGENIAHRPETRRNRAHFAAWTQGISFYEGQIGGSQAWLVLAPAHSLR
jgi:hypothetical protein